MFCLDSLLYTLNILQNTLNTFLNLNLKIHVILKHKKLKVWLEVEQSTQDD